MVTVVTVSLGHRVHTHYLELEGINLVPVMRENGVWKSAQYLFLVQLVGLRARAVNAYTDFWWSFSFLSSPCCGHADPSVV